MFRQKVVGMPTVPTTVDPPMIKILVHIIISLFI